MIITKVISTAIRAGRNIVKVLGFGDRDVRTGYSVLPFGIDSSCPPGYRAIYADTSNAGDKIVIGIISEKAFAQIGELRLHSENENGTESFYIFLRQNGICEIGGNTDFLVRYSGLESEFNKLKKAFNDFCSAYTPGSPTTVGTPSTIAQCTADITQAKSPIKTL